MFVWASRGEQRMVQVGYTHKLPNQLLYALKCKGWAVCTCTEVHACGWYSLLHKITYVNTSVCVWVCYCDWSQLQPTGEWNNIEASFKVTARCSLFQQRADGKLIIKTSCLSLIISGCGEVKWAISWFVVAFLEQLSDKTKLSHGLLISWIALLINCSISKLQSIVYFATSMQCEPATFRLYCVY